MGMKLDAAAATQKCTTLGAAAALMIVLGYPGELIVEGNLGARWFYWALAMVPFLYIVYELLVGFSGAGAMVAIQVGYCCSDVIAKCGVGLIIYQVTAAKSNKEGVLLQ